MFDIICKSSSINFCEPDYVYSIYIAEFWNTLSGIFLCLSSILFYYKHIKPFNDKIEFRCKIYNLNALLFIVGIGTILFHSQLLYISQLIDEIPMLLIVINYIKLLDELYNYSRSFIDLCFYKIIINNKIKIISIICITGFVNNTLHVFLFQGTMILCVIKYIFFVNKINNNIEIAEIKYIKEIKEIKYYHKFCLKITILSFSLWSLEQLFCDYFQHYYFHAIWHFLTSIGMYYYNYITLLYIKLKLKLID